MSRPLRCACRQCRGRIHVDVEHWLAEHGLDAEVSVLPLVAVPDTPEQLQLPLAVNVVELYDWSQDDPSWP